VDLLECFVQWGCNNANGYALTTQLNHVTDRPERLSSSHLSSGTNPLAFELVPFISFGLGRLGSLADLIHWLEVRVQVINLNLAIKERDANFHVLIVNVYDTYVKIIVKRHCSGNIITKQ